MERTTLFITRLDAVRNFLQTRRYLLWFIAPPVILGIIYLLFFAGLPDADTIKNYRPETTIYSKTINWNKLEHPVRIWAELNQISPLLQKAVVISEDDMFYQHDGINYDMMKEAFKINLKKKRFARGAGTITMQLARNAFLNKQKTLWRKIREIILARRIEKHLSKASILELYLNVVEWGENIYGAEAAARYYFGKSARNLNLSEASLLAAMLPNPKYFNPNKRLQSCKRMQKRVLLLMKTARVITDAQEQGARAEVYSLRFGTTALQPAAIDSLEEAKYDTSILVESEPHSFHHNISSLDSTAVPNKVAIKDSSENDSTISADNK